MIEFSNLYWQLDSTTKTNEKVAALREYLRLASPDDAIWAIHFLVGRRLKRLVGVRMLASWATEQVDLSAWMFEECYQRVGDLAETISLILPPAAAPEPLPLTDLIQNHLLPMQSMSDPEKRKVVLNLWSRFDQPQRFVLGKLMTGGFRVGVSKRLVTRAIGEQFEIDVATIAHRLMGDWEPSAAFYSRLTGEDDGEAEISKPYPFFLANPHKDHPSQLGDFDDWSLEWKWDGIRAQVIRREDQTFIWSRGEELVTEQFPDVAAAAADLPNGTVLDGELLAWDFASSRPLPFHQLQRRLGRKKVGKKLLTEVPVVLLGFDLLEWQSNDLRKETLTARQLVLKQLLQTLGNSSLRIPPRVEADNWEAATLQREQSKPMRAEGLMLKRRDSNYQVGRPTGDWWKWKVDPYTVDAVLIYAQRGHGRRASLYSDYTFAVWNAGELVPFAKAYSGLTDKEIRKVDAFIRKNTTERFGPVRSVTPELVFELAFENIQKSTRHKSGVAVRFPRISRWRHDKVITDADQLSTILELIEA